MVGDNFPNREERRRMKAEREKQKIARKPSPFNDMNKRQWLDHLYYKIGKQNTNFFLCGTYEKNGEIGFTKWRRYLDCVGSLDEINHNEKWEDRSFFEQINQRQILPNEIVLDIEDPTQLKPIIKELQGWDYHVFETGSRGYHIHLYFNRDMTIGEKENVVKKFDTDIQKCSDKNLIALENCPHWKTGRMKLEVDL